jgi:uncharacterized BrkB/YihY/UPF0761 family membrane protein
VRRSLNPTRDTLLFLAWMLAFVTTATSLTALRVHLAQPFELLAIVGSYVVLPAFWIALSWWLLPHGVVRWTGLVPGAFIVGTAMTFISIFNSLILFPWLGRQEETYGVLGVAAGLLFSFFLIGRSIELAAAANATHAERSTLARP